MKEYTVEPEKLVYYEPLDEGGQGSLHLSSGNRVFKRLWKPDDDFFLFKPERDREIAAKLIATLPGKLRLMDGKLHPAVVAPQELLFAYASKKRRLQMMRPREFEGFFMERIVDTSRPGGKFLLIDDLLRSRELLPRSLVGHILMQLWDIFTTHHAVKDANRNPMPIVAGDVNPRNYAVLGPHTSSPRVRMFDIDSASVGPYRCTGLSEGWADPHIVDVQIWRPWIKSWLWHLFTLWGKVPSRLPNITFRGTYSPETDWFSFAALAFAMLSGLGKGPFDGTHPGYTPLLRVKRGVTALHKGVVMPKHVVDGKYLDKLARLPVDIEYFHRVFVKGERVIPPRSWFERLVN